MNGMFKLRRLILDIYEYQISIVDHDNQVIEEELIKFLINKYKKYKGVDYTSVKTKIEELKREDLIKDTTNNGGHDKRLEITRLGYRVKRSWMSTMQLAVNTAPYIWISMLTVGIVILIAIAFS